MQNKYNGPKHSLSEGGMALFIAIIWLWQDFPSFTKSLNLLYFYSYISLELFWQTLNPIFFVLIHNLEGRLNTIFSFKIKTFGLGNFFEITNIFVWVGSNGLKFY